MHDGNLHPRVRFALTVEGSAQPGGGTTAEQADLQRAPRNVTVKIGEGKLTLEWEPVPDALFYNIYYKTTRGVTKEGKEFDRFQYDAVGTERFKTKIGVTKENGNLIDTAAPPYIHSDLANGMCYHYVVTAVTKNGESPESEEVMGIPAPCVCVMHFGTEGYDDGEFKSPTGIALDREGNIYVADTDAHTIQKFDKDGKFLMRLGDEPGDAEGQFYYPRGLTCTSQGDLIVIDANNHRIQKFDTDGEPILMWGKEGAFEGAFFYCRDVDVDFAGNVYVTDEINNRVQKF